MIKEVLKQENKIPRIKHTTTLKQNCLQIQPKWRKFFKFEANKVEVQDIRVTDAMIKEIFADIKNALAVHKLQKNIMNITFDLRSCDLITDKGFNIFFTELARNFPCTQELCLLLSLCPTLSAKSLANLGLQLEKHLSNRLRKLELNFGNCPSITDAGLRALASSMSKNSTRLVQLKIQLYHCYDVTDKGLQALFTFFGRSLIKLEALTINLTFCEKITDNGLEALASFGRFTNKLKHLTLSFNFIYKITDRGLAMLGCMMEKIGGNMESLVLSFEGCKRLTSKGLKEIGYKIFKNALVLRLLVLDFAGCVNVPASDKSKLQQIFSYIPSILIS